MQLLNERTKIQIIRLTTHKINNCEIRPTDKTHMSSGLETLLALFLLGW